MTKGQIIILIILSILIIIGYFGAAINNKEKKRFPYVILLTVICAIFILNQIILFEKVNDYDKQANKCPQYEQINIPVYKLK